MCSILLIWIISTFPLLALGRRGFILTSPKVLDTGTTEYLSLTLSDVPDDGELKVQLLNAHNDDVISEITTEAKNNHTSWIEFPVPAVREQDARLRLLGVLSSAVESYHIDDVRAIRLRNKGTVIFIQSDKSIYKPGQKVKFRILPVDLQLRPLQNVTGLIWIEGPNRVRVAQWKNVIFKHGFLEMELQLASEPTLGKWRIIVLIANVTETQEFQVKKYVLPKFEVYVVTPPFVLADAEILTWTICAKYTYGKDVAGVMDVAVTYKKFEWEKKDEKFPRAAFHKAIKGCTNINLIATEIEMHKRSYNYRSLSLDVQVTENGTGITQTYSSETAIEHNPLKIVFPAASQGLLNFKPGLPYYGLAIISLPNGKAAKREMIEICAQSKTDDVTLAKFCKQYETQDDGKIFFVVPPQDRQVTKLTIEVTAVNYSEKHFEKWGVMLFKPQAIMFLKAWHSPSGSFLQIEPEYSEESCGKPLLIPVKYTTTTDSRIKFYHQVVSRGRIVSQGSYFRTFSVSDDQRFERNDKYLNAEKTFGRDDHDNHTFPKHVGKFHVLLDVRVSLVPAAQVLVFYVREDGEVVADSAKIKEICLDNTVSLEFKYEQQYPGSVSPIRLSADPFSYCGLSAVDKSLHLLRSDAELTKLKILEMLNKFVFNQKTFPKQVTDDSCNKQMQNDSSFSLKADDMVYYEPHIEVESFMAFENSGLIVMSDFILDVRTCKKTMISVPELFYSGGEMSDRLLPTDTWPKATYEQPLKKPVELRHYFPETWLWETVDVGASGNVILTRELPHTITEWIGSAFCISPTTGIGVSDFTSVKTFQPFFVDLTLPYSVIRGETVHIVVTVFNYLQEVLSIEVTVEKNEALEVAEESLTRKMCVMGMESESRQLVVTPLKLGNINITIHAHSVADDIECNRLMTARLEAQDSITRQILVKPEGFPKEKVETIFFCPEDDEGIFHHEFHSILPETMVPGSASLAISATGDILGASIEGLEQLIRMPLGCGEQNILLFAPNIYILDYLLATDQISDDLKAKTLNFTKTGYQRQLNYRHTDGSYSAFGRHDREGSIWLTAFVVKSFSQASHYVDIDADDLQKSISWILQNQMENGCFPQIGNLFNSEIKGGSSSDDASLAPLTAYIMIALLESAQNYSKVIENGFFCVMAEENPSNYVLALFAYAAALSEHTLADVYFKELEERSVKKGNMMYWEDELENSLSVQVEIASYALLSMMRRNSSANLNKALSVVRWLVQQENSNGGFVSTQDTIVALNALSVYSSHAFRKVKNIDISVFVTTENEHFSFSVNNDNKLLLQSQQLLENTSSVGVQAVGDGCALAQMTLKYNVESASKNSSFDLQVGATQHGVDCNILKLDTCFRYLSSGKVSNMAVMEFTIFSGYVPDEKELQNLQKRSDDLVKLFEVKDSNVNFYFDEIKNEEYCMSFTIKKTIQIDNIKPAIIKLYDYYQPEIEASSQYGFEDGCHFGERIHHVLVDSPGQVLSNNSFPNKKSFYLDSPVADERNETSLPNHLSHFVDTNFELQFPDGIEGNNPVTILPDNSTLSDEGKRSCPECWTELPNNFAFQYCQSFHVLKVQIRNISSQKLKVVQDFSPSQPKPQNVNSFAKYVIHESCECPPLLRDSSYILIMGKSNIWQDDELHLTEDCFIFGLETDHENVQKKVRQAKKMCDSR